MSAPDDLKPQFDELVTFVQHKLPGLQAGEYQLTVNQSVDDSKGDPISDGSLAAKYTFAVLGDRFALSNPALQVNSVFPAPAASGEFTNVLPHVVFTSETFPWTRFPTSAPPFTPPPPGRDTDEDVPTWLAVLLFDEDDAAAFPQLSLPVADATIGDLFPPSVYSPSTLGDNYSYFWDAVDTSGLEPGQAVTTAIRVLDVPLELFWQVAPTIEDLKLTAHVRQVRLERKPTGQGADPGVPVGSFAVVFGTRLPQSARKSYAYLVSLEEMQPFLPTSEQGGPPPGGTIDGTRSVRLAVLDSWTFFSTVESARFVDDLLALNDRPAGSRTDAVNTNLRLPYGGTNPVVAAALDMGFVPLNETLRTAGGTVSWYRGPLVPYAMPRSALSLPISSPDSVMNFDPTTGMFDVSYAAAWTLGRTLALQDTAFSTELYNWKRGLSRQVIDAVEDEVLDQTFHGLGPAPSPVADGARPARALMRRIIHSLIRGD